VRPGIFAVSLERGAHLPKWLQHHHDLWNRRLTIPNFLGKKYRTVKITICERCNGKTFGKLETCVAPVLTSAAHLSRQPLSMITSLPSG
jgi:hypothetical protein